MPGIISAERFNLSELLHLDKTCLVFIWCCLYRKGCFSRSNCPVFAITTTHEFFPLDMLVGADNADPAAIAVGIFPCSVTSRIALATS